jgi:ABC-type dipeptide/oligopeptide/nickel transport systems, permease components
MGNVKVKLKFTTVFSLIVLLIVILMALFPGLFTPYNPLEVNMDVQLKGPSLAHLVGTDEYGRDILCRIIYGAQTSMEVGIGSTIFAGLIGVILGLIAGYFQGISDSIIMRILDAFLSFPALLLAILVITIFKASALSLIISIAVVNFPRFARIVRGNVLSLKSREFVEANRAFGAGNMYIMLRTMLPNCASSIIVQGSLMTAVAIIIEAGMSFLGLGIQPPQPAWGSMLSYSQIYLDQAPWYALAPGITIFLVVLSINLMGDALRDFFDPVKK